MAVFSHKFIEQYDGLVGFGLDRGTDEASLTVYLQMFADDDFMAVMRRRMTDEEIEEMIDHINRLLQKHLSNEEYHSLFLKDDEDH